MNYNAELRELEGMRLQPQTGAVLEIFLRRAGRLVSTDALHSALYDHRPDACTDIAARVAVHRVRRALQAAGVPAQIETVRGAGWVLRVPST